MGRGSGQAMACSGAAVGVRLKTYRIACFGMFSKTAIHYGILLLQFLWPIGPIWKGIRPKHENLLICLFGKWHVIWRCPR
jgi:hypothetical protein